MDKRILIVDDEESIRVLFFELLSTLPADCETAETVDLAEGRLAEATFDLVVSDFAMPGRNGLDLLHIVRERYPGTKFGIVTGSSGAAFMGDIRANKPDFLLVKPVDINTLLGTVREVLGMPQPE